MSHVIMKKNLAKALMDAGMEHFDLGGSVGGALTAQNGYGASLANTANTNYQPTINTAATNSLAGSSTANNLQAQQQSLANTLLAQSQGAGPNPAQTALNQSTGENVANQEALMASARGSAANPALIARQAAIQGANTQQQAVGQGATLQAQQELAAQTALQTQQQNQQAANVAEQNTNNTLFNSAATGQNAQNNTAVTNMNDMQSINSGVAAANTASANSAFGGVLNGAGAALTGGFGAAASSLFSEGGEADAPKTKFSTALLNGGKVPGTPEVNHNSPQNDKVPALLSPKEVVLPLDVTQAGSRAPDKAAEFMKALQDEKPGKGKDKKSGNYGDVIKAKGDLKSRIEKLEKLCYGGAA